MKVWISRFTAKQLRSIHKDHLGFILASSHCCNELTSVSPYLMFDHDIVKANEVESAFIRMRFYTLVRMQIAKIFEYRELCNGYLAKIRKTYPANADKIGKRFGQISRRINSANWAARVRNKIAFHFDSQHAFESLQSVPDNEPLNFMVGRMAGVTAFNFSDQILLTAMFLDAGDGDASKGADIIQDWTIALQKLITNFHAETMAELFSAYGLINSEEAELRDSYCAAAGSVAIPLSTLDKNLHRQRD